MYEYLPFRLKKLSLLKRKPFLKLQQFLKCFLGHKKFHTNFKCKILEKILEFFFEYFFRLFTFEDNFSLIYYLSTRLYSFIITRC